FSGEIAPGGSVEVTVLLNATELTLGDYTAEINVNDNCLKTKVSKKLKKWLDERNPGWDETQTACLY
ncbi:MAG: hypothetical protein ABFS56_21950, partial [Pseudomonadota bacterium]